MFNNKSEKDIGSAVDSRNMTIRKIVEAVT